MLPATYPVQFAVDYPDRPIDRLTTFFRLFTAIPIVIVLGAVSGGTWHSTTQGNGEQVTTVIAAGAGGLLFFAPFLMILFRQKYPRWWTTTTPPPTNSNQCTSTIPTRTPNVI